MQREAVPVRAALLAAVCSLAIHPLTHGQRQPRPEEAELAFPEALWTTESASRFGVVVSSSPEATRAGVKILEGGGNAVDAAVATAFAAGVAEPGSSGLGGQTLMLIVLADGRSVVVDGAGTAPRRVDTEHLWALAAAKRLFLQGSESIAVPGSLAALSLALDRYGSRSLADVLAPAIELAELGSTISFYEHAFVKKYSLTLRRSPGLCPILLVDCFDVREPPGRHCLPDLACTLRRIAEHGASDFYRGEIAATIERFMVASGGLIRRDDLAMLRATEREPLRGSYRGFEILSVPFPGGGAAVVETLHILERFPREHLETWDVERLHLLAEAQRLALADTLPRHDSVFAGDRVAMDKQHAARRASLIRSDRALTGDEIGDETLDLWQGNDTTQITVADGHGNVVTLTQTLGSTFGSGVVVPGLGFPLNSLLWNYDIQDPRSPVFLRPQRPPYSTMAPTVVLKDGKPLLALGSAGSGIIPSAIVGVISNLVDSGMGLCEAVTAPRLLTRGGSYQVVHVEVFAPVTIADANELERRGFPNLIRRLYPCPDPEVVSYWGSTNAVMIDPESGMPVGVGDPHRQGVALGAARIGEPSLSPVTSLPCWRELAGLPMPWDGGPSTGRR